MPPGSGNGSTIGQALLRQYAALFEMLLEAVQDCPEELWGARDESPSFRHDAYHTVFHLDFFLSDSPKKFRPPSFHIDGAQVLGNAPPDPFSREQIEGYIETVKAKCADVLNLATVESLGRENAFTWLGPAATDTIVYGLRHAQHHIGRMSAFLARKLDTEVGLRITLAWKRPAPIGNQSRRIPCC
jgi:hypothetical protein